MASHDGSARQAAVFFRAFQMGYCANCGDPAKVGALKITGWPYEINLCAGCVAHLAGEFERNHVPGDQDATQ